MPNVYEDENKVDARQSDDTAMKTTRFRSRYRALTDEEIALHDEIKTKAEELEALYEKVNDSRYKSLALTDLENSVMWIIKQLTS